VLLVLPDGIEFVAAWFGALKVGGVFAMANVLHTAEDYAFYLDYTRAPVVVVHEEVLPRVEAAMRVARQRPRLLVVGRAGGRHVEWDAALGGASERFENADTARDEPAGWLFTSGTTGHPKAAVHCHRDFPWNTELYARLAGRLGDEFESGACHAGRFESSMILAIAPGLVDEARRRALPPLPVSLSEGIRAGKRTFEELGGLDAYFGDPAAATAAEGEILLDELAAILIEAIAAIAAATSSASRPR
jgi:acyl-CoA synthetase (AMP-forming)/AMP-acid ligase II